MWRLVFMSVVLILPLAEAQTSSPPLTPAYTVATPSQVISMVIAKNGQSLVGIGKDGQLRQWSLPEGRLLRTFGGLRDIYLLLASDDGRWILAGDQTGEVIAWDSISGNRVFQTHLSRYPESGFVPVSTYPSAFSHSGKYLALSASGEAAQVLEWPSGRKLYNLESTPGGNTAIAFSRDDSRIASADSDGAIRIYDASNGKLLAHNDAFLTEPFAIDFTADSREVVAGGADKLVVFIDASTGKLARRLERFSDPVAYVAISPDGKHVSVALAKAESQWLPASVSAWNAISGEKEAEWSPSSFVAGAAWTSDGHWLMATSSPNTINVWRVY